MLSIKPIGSSGVDYYASLGKEDYYVNGGEPPGEWWGTGAEALGLTGEIEKEHLKNLLLGVSPDGEKKLVQNAQEKKRRAAFDLTFSVPKSVSVLWSQANLETRLRIEAACKKALYETLRTFDEQCGVTRRGKAGELIEKAHLLAGIFKHDTARGLPGQTPDPQLHFHVVLLNAVLREDGTTGAFDGRPLFKKHMKMALGALFRTELTAGLEQLGLTSHRPEVNGKTVSWFELDAVNKELLSEFSKRRREIEKWLIKHGLSGAKASEKAALLTREVKSDFRREELFSKWKELGNEFGLTLLDIKKELEKAPPTRNVEEEKAAAVNRALLKITSERAHFSELELLRFTAEEAQAKGLTNIDVKTAVTTELNESNEIVKLKNIDGERHFTTREMLELEARMLNSAKRMANLNRHPVRDRTLAHVVSRKETLRPEQKEALFHIVRQTGSVACVNGMAGTGKTFMLGAVREAFEMDGYRVLGTALAAKAAKGLESGSGIQSNHIHKLLLDIKRGRETLNQKTVLVVDEAGMVGTRQMEKLMTLSEKNGAKIVLVGDHKQLQAIDAGAPFLGISKRVGCVELSQIVRQREAWSRTAVTELSKGEAESALSKFVERGLLHISDDREEAMEKLVNDWACFVENTPASETLIFAGTNLEVTTINRLCQSKMLEAGMLSEECLEAGGEQFYVGDRVVCTKNNAALFIRNGSTGTVSEISTKERTLRITLDDGPSVLVEIEVYSDLKLSYSQSTHRGQGVTCENAFLLSGGMMTDREMSYVQASRARGETRIYTDVLSGGENIEALASQMNRSRPKDLAHDYVLEAV